MRKTPQEFKRENVKNLFDKILMSQKVSLQPLKIVVNETWQSDFTTVDLEMLQGQGEIKKSIHVVELEAKGFVDGIFKACHKTFSKDFNSLQNIKLVNYELVPKFKKDNSITGADASVEVSVAMEVRDHGIAEFNSSSRSILYSSLVATLEAFEFYINCEKTFKKIKLILEDARQRNRGDIVQSCVSDLSKLTEVNTYNE